VSVDEYDKESPEVKHEVEKARNDRFDDDKGNDDFSDDDADAKESQRRKGASALQR
jgi:hypothetical protein